MKKILILLMAVILSATIQAQVVTTKIVKVANNTTLFNENLVKDIEILDIANKRIYQTLKAIPANKSISTCVIDVDLKELQSNVVRAKNGLYIVSNDLRDTIKLGGTLTEPTTISQNGKTFKILDAGHGSVFGSSGIAYTKIDTASFADSTLITKLYAKKYKLKNDSVLPSGYATNYKVDEFFVPYRNAHSDVDLGAKNITSTQQNLPINVGVVVMPTHVKNGDGTITLGSNGTYNFAKSADGSTGISQKVVVSGTTITLTDNAVNFVYVDYNGGSPVYATSLDNMIFKDDFTKVPIIRATREGTAVHFEEYDLYGLLLANKLMVKDVYLNGGRRLSGLILSTAATRISTISAGSSVFAVQYYDNMAANIAGTAGSLYEYYLSSGVWNRSLVTSYDATYYSDGTNRQTLGNNKWVAKYYFRDIGDDNEAYYVHGHEYNNKSDAVNELIPAIPPVMAAHSVYVGKIVVEKDALNGTAYPRIWEGSVQNEGTSVHSDLSAESLVWGNSGHTGTVNNLASFDGTGVASYTPNNSTNWNTAYTHSQNDTDLSPTNEANTSLTYNQTTRVLSVTDPVATRSATLPLATTTVDGLMSKTDKTKLDAVPSSIDSLFVLQFDSIAVKYGYLYNWYALTDVRNITSSDDWKAPLKSDFELLLLYCGGSDSAAIKLKEQGSKYFVSSNNGTNELGFNARGSGTRFYSDGTFIGFKSSAVFMCSDMYLGLFPYEYEIGAVTNTVTDWYRAKYVGDALRLIKSSTTLSHGQTGTYTGNDGRVYRTICIGTQEWLADNLAETKYRNGALIPEVTDNTAWAALTTGARCSYNNMESLALAPISRDITINDTIYFDKTILGNSSQLEPLRVDTTIIATKHYVDSSTVGGTQTLSTNGSAGNISISSGNTITLNVNDHTNRTALDNVSGVNTGDQTLSSLGAQPQLNGTGFVKASGTTISYDNSTYELAFSKNTAFNKNFGTTAGTVLEGRTFGTAANNNTGDFIFASPVSAQSANIWINGHGKFGGNVSILSSSVFSGYVADAGDGTGTGGGFSRYATDGINKLLIGTETSAFGGISGGGLAFVYDNYPFHVATNSQKRFTVTGDGFSIFSSNTNSIINNGVDRVQVDGSINTTGYRKDSTPLLLDWLKSGSAPASGNIIVGNGTTTNPSGVSVNQAIGGNALTNGYLPYWDGSKLANISMYRESETTIRQFGRFWVYPQFNDNADYAFNVTGYAGAPNHIALFGQSGFSNGFTVDFNGSNMVYTMRNGNLILENLSGTGTRLVSATSDGTLGSNNITTDASNNLSGINNLTMSGDARINSLASDDKAEVSVFPDGTLTRKSIAPYIASSTSYTLNVAANVNAQFYATSDITITLSNISPGESGVIEVVYTGASVVTFIVNSTLTLQIEDSIYNSTTNAYTKSVLSKSSGSAKYEYYRSGNNILGKIFIDGKQNYQ